MAILIHKIKEVSILSQIRIFEPRFNDDELYQEFLNFFETYGLLPLFTNEHRAGSITVTYVDARSVVLRGGDKDRMLNSPKEAERKKAKFYQSKGDGADRKTLLKFADYLQLYNDNQMYEDDLFFIIYESKTFRQMIERIKKLMRYIDHQMKKEHEFNMWNVVWYDHFNNS